MKILGNEVMQVIRARRSVRVYSPEPVEEEKVRAIVEAAIFAPSARNGQPWFFTVVQNGSILERIEKEIKRIMHSSEDEFLKSAALREDFQVFHRAQTVVFVSGKEDNSSAPVDCAAATENMLLAAKSLDVASCWIGFAGLLFLSPEASEYRRLLKIPEGYRLLWGVTLGYTPNYPQEVPERKWDVFEWIE